MSMADPNWRTARLGEVCTIVSGSTPKTSVEEYWGGDIPWATPKDLSALEGSVISVTSRRLTKLGLASCSSAVLPAGSVLFSSRAPIGHVAINSVPMATNQGFKSLIPKAEVLDARFLYWWLKGHRPMLEALGNGATFKEVSKSVVEKVEIPLPPMFEQRRIAGILDTADALRAKRRESIELLDSLSQSIFLDMFGDPSANDQGWALTPLKEVLCGIDSGRSPVCLDREANDGEWGVLKLGAISSGRYMDAQNKALPLDVEPHRANEVREGDVLFSRKNTPQLVAKTAWVRATKPRMLLPDLIFRLVPGDALDPGYLSAVLSNPRLNTRVRSLATGSAASMVNISKSKLLDFRIPAPPLYLQRRFVAITERVEGSRSLAQANSSEMDSFFSSLQARAFRGEL